MSVLPQIERQLRAAAERRARHPLARRLVGFGLPRVPSVGRQFAIALLVLLSVAGAALAAKALIGIGRPAPREYPDSGQVVLRKGTRVLSLRVPDPAGGPPWGMRLIYTAGHRPTPGKRVGLKSVERPRWGCVQVGRIVDGKLGVLGQDGAFHNDHLFHELPIQPEGCGRVDASGLLTGLSGSANIETASAYQGLEGCVTQTVRRLEATTLPSLLRQLAVARSEHDAQVVKLTAQGLSLYRHTHALRQAEPTCLAADQRHILFAVAGPEARAVVVSGEGVHETIPLNPADDGSYMVVFRGALKPGARITQRVSYRDGRPCPAGGPAPGCVTPTVNFGLLRRLRPTATPASRAGLRPTPQTPLSRRAERDPSTANPVTVTPLVGAPHTRFTISFHALLEGGGYSYVVRTDGSARCQDEAQLSAGGTYVAIGGPAIVRGQTITRVLTPRPRGLCPGSYHVFVAFSDPRSTLENFPFANVGFRVSAK